MEQRRANKRPGDATASKRLDLQPATLRGGCPAAALFLGSCVTTYVEVGDREDMYPGPFLQRQVEAV